MPEKRKHPYEALSHAGALAMFEQWKMFRNFYLQTGVPPWSVLLTEAEKKEWFADPTLRKDMLAKAATPEQAGELYAKGFQMEGK